MTQTSRTPILDQVLAIRNLLALNDHQLEQVINLQQEKFEADVPIFHEDQAMHNQILESYDKDIEATWKQYRYDYILRKQIQNDIFAKYNIDKSYWCQFKHKLTIQEALKEIADATGDAWDKAAFTEFTKKLYEWIGEITGLGHTPCGRCLLDAEENATAEEYPEPEVKKENTEGMED